MSVAIRTDASLRIGTGHVMRCLALAERLRIAGASISFICRDLPGSLCDLLETRKFIVHRLLAPSSDESISVNDSASEWLSGVSWRIDAEQTRVILDSFAKPIDWLIVDHYALEREWEQAVRPTHCQVLVIDDLANRSHDCDLLLDQNFKPGADVAYSPLVPDRCRLLLGPSWALLRSEFREERRRLRIRDGSIRRIFVFFGGIDPSDETGKALESINRLEHENICFDVVIGAENPHREQLQMRFAPSRRIFIHHGAINMAKLMGQADLAIGAGGVTTWERCCLGVASVVVTVARNQEPSTEAMAADGRLLYLGRKEKVTSRVIEKVVAALLDVPSWVRYLSEASAALVDGLGCERLVSELVSTRVNRHLGVANTFG